MKGYKVPVVIILIILMAAGWVNLLIFGMNRSESLYIKTVSEAKDYYERGLYQLSAAKYEDALKYKETKDTRNQLLVSYAAQYAQDEKAYPDYLFAAQAAALKYPTEVAYLNTITDLYIGDGKYVQAYAYLDDAIKMGIDDESISRKYIEVKYSYQLKTKEFADFRMCSDSRFLVSDGSAWSIIDNKGYIVNNNIYSYISPPNPDGLMMYVDKSGAKLIDKDEVVQGLFSASLESAGFCSEDLISIRENGSNSYYSIRGDKLFGDYEEAGTFTNGLAAVKIDGKWGIIDSEGSYVIDPVYEDIKLDPQGKYVCNYSALAKVDGQYHLYDSKWNVINNFSCDDMDIPTEDGVFAFSSDGKWGFADTKGNVVVEPVYDQAKSFSNGLAAVCKDGLWGFIDKEGNTVIAFQFLDAGYFNSKGGCMVRTSPESWKLLHLNIIDD